MDLHTFKEITYVCAFKNMYTYMYKKWRQTAVKLELTLPFLLHSGWDPQPLLQLSPTRLQSSAEC